MRVARRTVLRAAPVAALAALAGHPPAAAAATGPAGPDGTGAGAAPAAATGPAVAGAYAAGETARVRLTRATNGAATATATGDRVVAEAQGVLWSLPPDGAPATRLTPPDLEPGRPVFSPDGRRIAMSAYRGGAFHIWVMDAGGSRLRRLTDGPFDHRAPAWSPDGRHLAFCSERGGDPVNGGPYRIWTVPLTGGRPVPLTGLPGQPGPGQEGAWEDFDPVWTPDGARVLFVRATVDGETLIARTLASVAADGRGPVRVDHTVADGSLLTPALSPAGRTAWLSAAPGPRKVRYLTLHADGRPVPLEGDLAPAPPRWIGDDRLLVTLDGRFRVIRPHRDTTGREIPLDATLEVPRPRYRVKEYALEADPGRPVHTVHQPCLSPDGRTVAFAALNALWTVPVAGGAPRRIAQAPTTAYVQGPVWTPDGRALIHTDDRDGLNAVRRRELDGGHESVLADGGRVYGSLSPDGTRLACLDLAGRLLVRDLATSVETPLVAALGGGGLPSPPSWSSDGRHIALCDRNRISHRFREGHHLIRIVDTATGAARLHALAPHTSLSDGYASGPVWSPDGRFLACVAESALWLLPVTPDGTPTGPARRLTDESADHPSWAADSRTLLYQSGDRLRLLVLDAHGAPARRPRTVPVALTHRRPAPVDTVVHAGLLWDGTGTPPRADVDVLISGGRVTAVEPHRPGRRAARTVDASRGTVLPGLWDAHVHPYAYTYGARQGLLHLAYGVTTTVSLGGSAHEQARLRDDIRTGRLTAPRLLAGGELLDGSRVAYAMGRAHRTAEGLARSLTRAQQLDWDFVKTYVRAPYAFMEQAARFAHERLGVRAGSHLCAQGIASGQDLTTHLVATERAEHGHGATPAGHTYEDTLALYTHGGFDLIATPFTALPLIGADPSLADDPRVTALMPPWDVSAVRAAAALPPTAEQLGALERETGVYRRILAGGGRVALGTDAPLTPVGLHLHLALRALHRYGFSPAEALTTATRTPARVFGVAEHLGTVEPGKLADLTLVDGDPFTDFADLVRVRAAVRAGTLHERAALEAARPRGAGPGHDWQPVLHQMLRDGCCTHRPHGHHG
ncbi:translocation protein TolB [Streptomyces lavendulae subsp. lavendulae]|uniref:Translocation protein TolB n=1 Tax=Streptomyces lavendulae subsp. lavendulae TaxID=58340 RepID=A0A2K8P7C3_STRLA|nr:translocation protein TolB [Streptomyces lavendulae subsp. lavendulae]QUQ52483.1 Tol-Pal system protein TolB [Streptomyces lavendulae subsp. lavendulae]